METSPTPSHRVFSTRLLLITCLSLFLIGTQLLLRRGTYGPNIKSTREKIPLFDVADDDMDYYEIDGDLEDFWTIPELERPSDNNRFKRPLWRPPANSASENGTCLSQPGQDAPVDWQRRAPYFVLIGAMKAGTEALSFYLRQHPQIPKPKHKEGRFFDLKFERFATNRGILQEKARSEYTNYMRQECIQEGDLLMDESLFALDNSPRYLFWSDIVPERLLCVAPWVKLVVVLRNPVDRAYSHYNMELSYKNKRQIPPSFEERIQMDLDRLTSLGISLEKGTDDAEMRAAWKSYTRGESKPGFFPHAVLGRGMYALQLKHWYEAMEKVGKPKSDLLIVRSEDMRSNPSGVVGTVLKFLDLESFNISDTEEQHLGNYKAPMNNETRQLLQEFFEPYNRRLYDMLGWEAVWDT